MILCREVKSKRLRDWFRRGLGKSLKQSEVLQRPASFIFGRALNIILSILVNSVTLCLLFPLALRSLVSNLVFLCIVVWVMQKLFKGKGDFIPFLRWWIGILLMLLFAAIAPFLVLPHPIYVAFVKSVNPLRSNASELFVAGKCIGTVLILPDSDFVRGKLI